jgi:primosomal protein N' (replication factor Y)
MPRHLNVARVVLDNPLPHLDRLFDYEIPEEFDEACVPGVKVKVKFSNRNMEAWVVEKIGLSNHHKKLSEISKVISNFPVLTPEILTLSQIVADRFIGNLTDVLRFAIPPRQAKIEKAFDFESIKTSNLEAKKDVTQSSLTIPPCVDKDIVIIEYVKKIFALGKQSLILFPNIYLVEEFKNSLLSKAADIRVHVLSAEQEPSVRYKSFLEILANNVDVVLGTRNAIFAPLKNLGLIAIWDDADENYFSQQSPYWNAREVAILRANLNECDFMSFGNSESVAINQLIKDKVISRKPFVNNESKDFWPQVFTLDNSSSDPLERTKRFPNKAWELVKEGLKTGNVLVQVPRLGYSSNLQCTSCRESARCNGCSGPLLTKQKNSAPECKWCGKVASSWRCRYCNTREFRISVVGQTKTVEELGKSFPGVNILTSGGTTILRNVEETNSIIVATPGAEPKTPNGYSAAILLDAYLLLGVPSLAASEEAIRKWLHLFTLLKPESAGGKVFITSESTNRVVQALIKHDPNWLINNEQELRAETKLHPSVTTISLKGDLKEINQLLETFNQDASLSVMGPRIFEKEELAQIVIGTNNPEDIISKVRSEIIKFSVARTKPVRAHVNAYDID